MAFPSTMGLSSDIKRATGPDARSCENEHGDTAQGQVGEVIVYGPSEKIVNILFVPPVAITVRELVVDHVTDCIIIMMYCISSQILHQSV